MQLRRPTDAKTCAWPADPAPNSSALLALYERAYNEPIAVFEAATVAQLERLVGCDGAVWGRGSVGPRGVGVRFEAAEVFGRPRAIVTDYAGVGREDPAARAFFEQPERVQAIEVGDFYQGAHRGRIREYLNAYAVRHLMLGGGRAGPAARMVAGGPMSWITLYRSDLGKPFAEGDATLFAALLPHCVQAHDMCTALGLARAVPTVPPVQTSAPAQAQTGIQPRVNRPAGAHDRNEVRTALSAREREVLALVARGFSYTDAAVFMGVSIDTVRSHVRNLYGKLGVHSKTEAVFEARLSGWLD